MKLEVERTEAFRENMTDRQKRKALDQELRKLYPKYSKEEIRRVREEHIAQYYGKYGRYLPQPQERTAMEPSLLTLQILGEKVVNRYHDMKVNASMNRMGPFHTGLVVALGLIWFMFASTALVVGFWDLLLGLLVFPAAFVLRNSVMKRKRREAILSEIEKDGLRSECWVVENMGWSCIEGTEDVTTFWYLKLIHPETHQRKDCSITRYGYESIREGDTIWLLYLDREKYGIGEPVYLLNPHIWTLDDQLRQLLGI